MGEWESPPPPCKERILSTSSAKALVYYYPLAGRLREIAGRKLVVDCTAEGVLFVEADADATLQQLGHVLHPPFPDIFDQLLYTHPGSHGITNCPLLLFQVTRLKCGGFIMGTCFNHAMSDGAGTSQFISAIGEVARGAVPSIPPVWQRHLLSARRPPLVSFSHREYNAVLGTSGSALDKMVHRSFLFSAADISALRSSLPPWQMCSKFEVVAACAWRCRTIALSPKTEEEVRFMSMTDIRMRMKPPLPVGYYGNAIVVPAAVTTAEELSKNPLQYAVELVRKTKQQATDEYVRSVADLMVMRDRPSFTTANTYMVSDVIRVDLKQVDFGWGKPVYGGVAKGVADWIPQQLTWLHIV